MSIVTSLIAASGKPPAPYLFKYLTMSKRRHLTISDIWGDPRQKKKREVIASESDSGAVDGKKRDTQCSF